MTSLVARLRTALHVVALLTTTWLLVATSSIDDYDDARCVVYTPPVTFRVSGTCGPGGGADGVIVVHVSRQRGDIWIENSRLLGLPPVPPVSEEPGCCPDSGASGHGRYVGDQCPFDLASGPWDLFPPDVETGDAGATADGGVDGGSRVTFLSNPSFDAGVPPRDGCRALEVDGVLTLICREAGLERCRSRLIPVE